MKKELDLGCFLNPKSIAVIGASDHPDKVGGVLMTKILKSKCNIIPINPSHDILFGKKCYDSVLKVSDSIDLAVIAIPAKFVEKALVECGEKKIKNVIIITAGFSEVGKKEEENRLLEIAKKYEIRLLGPNCFGVANSYIDLDTTFAASSPKKGDIAFISQSGALWSYVSELDGFSGFVSLGNMADLEFSDFIEYFLKEDKTKKIMLYIEKLKDGRKFVELCKNSKKKIYAVKAGSSEEGKQAAISHTGSLATDYEVYKGAFKQAGVELCESVDEAIVKAGVKLKFNGKSKNKLNLKNVEIITNAGGAGALVSDYLSASGVKVLGVKDVLGTALSEDYLNALEKSKEKDIVVILTPQYMSEVMETAEVVIDFKKRTRKNILALFLGGKSVESARDFLEKNDVVCFNLLDDFRRSLK